MTLFNQIPPYKRNHRLEMSLFSSTENNSYASHIQRGKCKTYLLRTYM